MPYTPTTWVEGVTTLGPTNMNKIEAALASLSAPAPSATPPASPADGDIWYCPADSTNGVIWQFRYNSGEPTYKWEFVGGPPYFAAVTTTEALGTNNAWTTTATNCEALAPRTGDYLCTAKSLMQVNTASPTFFLGVADASVSSTAIGDQGAGSTPVTNGLVNLVAITRLTAVPATHIMRVVYFSAGAGASAAFRTLSVVPIRVS